MVLNNIPPIPDERIFSTGYNPLDKTLEKENHSTNQSNFDGNKNNKYFVSSEQRNSKQLHLQILD